MSDAEELRQRAEALRDRAERESDDVVALLCRALASAYEAAASRPPKPLYSLH
jgi:hypothetical protein